MFRCIFCRQDLDDSRRSIEHVFPEAIGGTLKLRDLCKPCNDLFGHSADVSLTDHFLIKMDRRFLRVNGKGAAPNPFERGLLHEPEGSTKVRWEETGYVYRHPSKRTVDGRDELWLDPRDAGQGDGIRRRSQAREGRDGEPLQVKVAKGYSSGTLDFPIDTSMASAIRGLVKIAYETAALLVGDTYLNGENAESVRDFLRDPAAGPESLRVDGKFVDGGGLSRLAAAGISVLIAGVVPSGRSALSYVRIFNRCELVLRLGDSLGDLDVDGAAFRIDITEGGEPARTTFRDLGWFG